VASETTADHVRGEALVAILNNPAVLTILRELRADAERQWRVKVTRRRYYFDNDHCSAYLELPINWWYTMHVDREGGEPCRAG
jgi:hypothetical protein